MAVTEDAWPDTIIDNLAFLSSRGINSEMRRILGISGGAASGKSTLARQLSARLNQDDTEAARVIQMDGFHLTNNSLSGMQVSARFGDPAAPLVGAASVKGSPLTMDATGFEAALVDLRTAKHTRTCPVYDRESHNPKPHAVKIPRACRVLFAEGLYMLLGAALQGGSPWRGVQRACQQHWAVWIPQRVSFLRICRRKVLQGGRSLGGVLEHWPRSEQATWRLITPNILQAQLIMHCSPELRWCMLPSSTALPPSAAYSGSLSLGCPFGVCEGVNPHSTQAAAILQRAFDELETDTLVSNNLHVCGCALSAWCNRPPRGTAATCPFGAAARQVLFDASPVDAVHCAVLLFKQLPSLAYVCVDVPSGIESPAGVACVRLRRASLPGLLRVQLNKTREDQTGALYFDLFAPI